MLANSPLQFGVFSLSGPQKAAARMRRGLKVTWFGELLKVWGGLKRGFLLGEARAAAKGRAVASDANHKEIMKNERQ